MVDSMRSLQRSRAASLILLAALLPGTPGAAFGCDVIAFAAGTRHSLALKSDRTLWAWGQNDSGQLGLGQPIGQQADACVPSEVSLDEVTALAAGDSHSLALKADGSVWAWGSNAFGQLGFSLCGATPPQHLVTTPTAVPVDSVTAIAAGSTFSLALIADGTVWAWGDNDKGQLGVDPATIPARVTPEAVPGLANVMAIAAGHEHALALDAEGLVWSWGYNGDGQLGRSTAPQSLAYLPAQVAVFGITAIAAGANHTLALGSDGLLQAWGANDDGQLGDGTQESRATPAAVSGLTSVRAIAAGARHSVAVAGDGTGANGFLWAWGFNGDGELAHAGLPQPQFSTVPVEVEDASGQQVRGVSRIAAGGYHTLALKVGEALLAWGEDSRYQLGGPKPDLDDLLQVGEFRCDCEMSVVVAEAGGNHSVGLLPSGKVIAWGNNGAGQLGDGSRADAARGVAVVDATGAELGGAIAVAAGDVHSLALLVDGTVWAWGDNDLGQLGFDPLFLSHSTVALQVPGLGDVIAISAGGGHSLALKANGDLWAWGDGEGGKLGWGSDADSYVPVRVQSALRWRSMTGGGVHSMGIADDGTVWSWGRNDKGQLGDGGGSDSNVPVSVVILPQVPVVQAVEVAAGGNHALVRLANGSVQAWGEGNRGKLGNGSLVNSPVATPVFFPTNPPNLMRAIGAGANHSLAIRGSPDGSGGQAGDVLAWGDNSRGQLGELCQQSYALFPVQVQIEFRVPPPQYGPLRPGLYVSGGGVFLGNSVVIAHTLAGTTKNEGPDANVQKSQLVSWGENGDGQLGLGYFGSYVCVATAFQRTPDPIPGDQGNVLFGVKESNADVHLYWDEVPPPWPGPWRVYWWYYWEDRSEIGDLIAREGDSGFDPLTNPNYLRLGVVPKPPYQIYYRLMGVSRCYGDPGP